MIKGNTLAEFLLAYAAQLDQLADDLGGARGHSSRDSGESITRVTVEAGLKSPLIEQEPGTNTNCSLLRRQAE